MDRRKLLVALLVVVILAVAVTVDHDVSEAANTCTTRNLWAHDLGGGSLWDRNYVIDVWGVPRNDGIFIYNYGGTWSGVRWHPIANIPGGFRFGVSTGWAYGHPGWQNIYWKYVYQC